MRSMAIAALAAGLCLSAAPGQAQVTGDNFVGGKTSDLAALCGASQTDPNVVSAINHCHGFLMATGQFHTAVTQPGGRMAPFVCLPQTRPTIEEVRVGFVRWAGSNPQFAAVPAVEGVIRYGAATWPCPARQATRASRATQ